MFEQTHVPDWWKLTLWPTASLLLLFTLFSLFRLDQQLASSLYDPNQAFPFARSVAYEFWLHRLPRLMAVAGFFLLVLLALIPWRGKTLKRWYVPLWLAIAAMLVSSSLVGHLKRHTDVYCPSQLEQFGGSHRESISGLLPAFASDGGHCWPAGHATTGMVFIALYFALLMMAKPRLATFSLASGLVLGNALGLAQVIRGQHYLSHQVWTTAICWFISLAVFWSWQTWAAPRIFLRQPH